MLDKIIKESTHLNKQLIFLDHYKHILTTVSPLIWLKMFFVTDLNCDVDFSISFLFFYTVHHVSIHISGLWLC